MIKKTIRGLSLIAVFALLTAFLPLTGNGGFTAFAADGFVVEDGVLTEYNGPGGAVTIPTYVREIGSYAFSGNEDITCVTIPSSVTKIGNDAFNGCTGLTKVTMKDSVTRIDEYAFYHCTALTGIAIPSSVTFIGNGAFYECVALKNVSIPSSVKSIGYSIFFRLYRTDGGHASQFRDDDPFLRVFGLHRTEKRPDSRVRYED